MTVFVLFVGGLLTAWVDRTLELPPWIWAIYAAAALWALVIGAIRRKEEALALHALMDLRDRVSALGGRAGLREERPADGIQSRPTQSTS